MRLSVSCLCERCNVATVGLLEWSCVFSVSCNLRGVTYSSHNLTRVCLLPGRPFASCLALPCRPNPRKLFRFVGALTGTFSILRLREVKKLLAFVECYTQVGSIGMTAKWLCVRFRVHFFFKKKKKRVVCNGFPRLWRRGAGRPTTVVLRCPRCTVYAAFRQDNRRVFPVSLPQFVSSYDAVHLLR